MPAPSAVPGSNAAVLFPVSTVNFTSLTGVAAAGISAADNVPQSSKEAREIAIRYGLRLISRKLWANRPKSYSLNPLTEQPASGGASLHSGCGLPLGPLLTIAGQSWLGTFGEEIFKF